MSIHIILTKDQADQVRGVTTPGHALEPFDIKDGRYILPVSVLGDPAHQRHHAFLQSLPQADISNHYIRAVLEQPIPVQPPPPMAPVRGGPTPRAKGDPLLGPKLKLEWAKRHIEELKATLHEFYKTSPYEVVVETDPQTGENVYRLRVHKCVPVEISAILGDAVHNLRAALDQLLCALIRHNGNVPGLKQGFPIANRRGGHESFVRKKIEGVSAEVERLILRLKPYPGGNPHLWRLHELDILDKHDGIVPVGAAHAQTSVRWSLPGMFIGPDGMLRTGGAGNAGKPFSFGWGTPAGAKIVSPLTDNVEIYRSPAGLPEEVQVAIQIAFDQSTVAKGEPVVETLEEFARFVEKLLGVFERQTL